MGPTSPTGLRSRGAAAPLLASLVLLAAPALPASARSAPSTPSGAAGASEGGAESRPPADRVWDVLLDAKAARTADDVLVSRLVSIGPESIPTLFGIVSGTEERLNVDPASLPDPRPLVRPVDGVALAALGELPPESVLDHLSSVRHGRIDLDERLAMIRVLGVVSTASAASSILELAGELQDHELRSVGTQNVVRQALVRTLAHGPLGYVELSKVVRELDERLLSLVVRSVGEAGRGEGVALLGELLGREPALDLVLLDQIAQTGARVTWQVGDAPAELLRPYLDGEDARLRGQAALGLGELQDVGSFPRLVTLLSDRDAGVARCALFALQTMSGQDLPADAEEWTRWYDGQMAWLENEAPELRAELTSPEPSHVMSALQGLCQHRFFRNELADELATALHAEAVPVNLAACTALAQLGSQRAVPYLIDAMRWDEEVSMAAWKALVGLTGADLPRDGNAWETRAERGFRN